MIIYEKAELVLALIRNLSDSQIIEGNHYDPYMPHSQTITCQETVREGKLVNMPLNLIVRGDLIRLVFGLWFFCGSNILFRLENFFSTHFN